MARRHLSVLYPLALVLSASPQSQPKPQFEVASIKRSNAIAGSSGIASGHGRINAENVTLKRCIRGAYGVPESQILGGPDWFDQDIFNILAKAPSAASDSELMVMLQSLLADRFHLAFHRESRNVAGYALVAGKSGIKVKVSDPDVESKTTTIGGNTKMQMLAVGCTMEELARKLSDALRTPVADQTGVLGRFHFNLEWTRDEARVDANELAGIFTALPEQLGLRLEGRKVPTQFIVVDRADPPTEN